ncbi:hypothetical protein BVRB_8g181080 [Beta vulgaris subsp. vulgaris]|nr:hypothetical protein BVRB_8g181080 [Beta vulgaris subsp. vulgaris]
MKVLIQVILGSILISNSKKLISSSAQLGHQLRWVIHH